MRVEEAQIQAQKWWGLRGKAQIVPTFSLHAIGCPPLYKIGRTTLNAALGGPMIEVLATSLVSFEEAFSTAYANGYGPDEDREGMDEEYDDAK